MASTEILQFYNMTVLPVFMVFFTVGETLNSAY